MINEVCRRVCFEHAKWIMGNSIVGGHSSNCPEANIPTKPFPTKP